MSIQRGLARNLEVYRLLFAEETNSLPPLPDGDDSFEETAAAAVPQQSVYRIDPPYPLTAPDIRGSNRDATSPTAAEAAAQALLRRLDDEARLLAQDLEEE